MRPTEVDVETVRMTRALVDFAEPILDGWDGSDEQMHTLSAFAMICWNLALMPEPRRELSLGALHRATRMTTEAFVEFRRQVIEPMIQRHERLFPQMHGAPAAVAANFIGTNRLKPAAAGAA